MKKNIIAVCDSDAEYACNFAEYLNNKKKLPFQAVFGINQCKEFKISRRKNYLLLSLFLEKRK